MKNNSLFYAAFAVSVLVFACKDKTPDPQPDNTPDYGKRAGLLMASNWKITSLNAEGIGEVWNNSLFVAACNRDNQYRFRSDDSVTSYEGASKCNSSSPDSTRSFYKLYNDNKQLLLNMNLTDGVVIDDTVDILELTADKLKLSIEYSGIPGTVTFVHP